MKCNQKTIILLYNIKKYEAPSIRVPYDIEDGAAFKNFAALKAFVHKRKKNKDRYMSTMWKLADKARTLREMQVVLLPFWRVAVFCLPEE